MQNWETRLGSWTRPPSDNEDEKRERTEHQIKDALKAHPRLASQPIRIYAKGSYANNTNVRLDSDVDINVEYTGGFYYDFHGIDNVDDQLRQRAGINKYTGPYSEFEIFKEDVEQALRAVFGAAVKREDKCITVRNGATTLPADVVPCWEYRYFYDGRGSSAFNQGTVLFPDKGYRRIVNYPQQHHDNGVAKNTRTGRSYKRAVRSLKRLENEMVASGVIDEVPSYLIECLVYSCPDACFAPSSNLVIAKGVLATISTSTIGSEPVIEADRLLEVNEIKFLFHVLQKWDRSVAHRFADAAWDYLELG